MKIINKLTLAALAAMLLFQTPIAQANDHGAAKINFTKWVTVPSPRPGVFADMAGTITGGDVGDGQFTGEVLSRVVNAQSVVIVEAIYHVTGAKHSFTARIHAEQQIPGIGQMGVISGVVTEGWLKGHSVEGEWTVIPPCGYGGGVGIGNCFEVNLDIIKRHFNH